MSHSLGTATTPHRIRACPINKGQQELPRTKKLTVYTNINSAAQQILLHGIPILKALKDEERGRPTRMYAIMHNQPSTPGLGRRAGVTFPGVMS